MYINITPVLQAKMQVVLLACVQSASILIRCVVPSLTPCAALPAH